MAYVYRSSTTNGNSSSNGLNVTKPSGTANGDVLVAVCYLEGSSGSNTWTTPAGWSIAGSPRAAGTEFNVALYWKIASNELTSASWVFTPASVNNWRSITCGAYSGGVSPAFDVWSASSGLTAITTAAPTVTTTAASDLLTFGYGNYSGTDATSTFGAAASLRASLGGTVLADWVSASLGPSGSTDIKDAIGSQDYSSHHVAIKLGTAGSATAKRTGYLRPWGIFG